MPVVGDICMDIGIAFVLIAYVAVSTVVPWRGIFSRGVRISRAALIPLILLSLSSALQGTFIALVQKKIFPLEYSLRFAALGVPLCILALALATRGKSHSSRARGTVTCIILGLVMWMFLITVH